MKVFNFSGWVSLFILVSCATPIQPPNILLIVADDTGWNDVGYHNPDISTPHIDQLCRLGLELEQFYVYPTCSPTRAALLTGRYASRFGISKPIAMSSKQVLPTDIATLPGSLHNGGYQTAIMGKWHLGLNPESGPLQYGFEYSYGFLHGQIDQYTHLYKNGDRSWHRMDRFVEEEGHATDLITDEAIKFITATRDKQRPFFIYVPYSVPHYPVQENEKWLAEYHNSPMVDSRKLFAASMTHMDHAIGRLITALEEENIQENTLVVFMSDNGGQLSWTATFEYGMRHGPYQELGDNAPLRGSKTEVYEGGIRVPALLYWPGEILPGKYQGMIKVTDLFPTLTALAGIETIDSSSADGNNVWESLTGKGTLENRSLFLRTNSSIAYRKGDWKLIHHAPNLDTARNELFNLANDPLEQYDVIDNNREIFDALWLETTSEVNFEENLEAFNIP
ncbi:MAG: arylsulfatase [Cyclobacteriaceae bacterium]|nr:MAG: arylsulfatase [Cyclobacteriaceae bacterium]